MVVMTCLAFSPVSRVTSVSDDLKLRDVLYSVGSSSGQMSVGCATCAR